MPDQSPRKMKIYPPKPHIVEKAHINSCAEIRVHSGPAAADRRTEDAVQPPLGIIFLPA